MKDTKKYRKFLADTHTKFPEIFPPDFIHGFYFHDIVTSEKQNGFEMRRIRLESGFQEVCQIRPSFMMPYMIFETIDVGKPLCLRRRGVPSDALAWRMFSDTMPCSGDAHTYQSVVIP